MSIPGGADFSLTVGPGGVPEVGDIEFTFEDASPPPIPLSPDISLQVDSSDVTSNAEKASAEAPDGSATQSMGSFISQQLIGITPKSLKENFKNAMAKDAEKKPFLKWATRLGRVAGLSIGIMLNVASRFIALGVGIAATAVTGAYLVLFEPGYVWSHPREALAAMIGSGAVAGAAVGALTGSIGNLFIKYSLSIKDFGNPFYEAVEHNTTCATAGGLLAAGAFLIVPTFWSAAWKK